MKKVGLLMSAFLLGGCIGAISTATHADLQAQTQKVDALLQKQVEAIRMGAPTVEVVRMIGSGSDCNSEISKICADKEKVPAYLYQVCMGYQLHNFPLIAEMSLNAAKYCADTGDQKTAKQIYRSVILEFRGPYYETYRKRAEFGLEDLRATAPSLPAAQQKQGVF